MASSYTGLGTELMTTGENAGTWGSTTNTNLQILEQISGGYTAQSIAGGVQTTTLSVSDGSTGAVLAHRVIEFTGTITGNQTVTIPLDVQQLYVIKNNTSGAYTVNFKYATGSGDSVTWGASDKGTKLVYAAADHATNPNLVDSNIGGVGAVDLNGATLTLDADGDTDITADTDDQIDIKIAGADDFQFTANTFTAQSGSTIAAQALTATTITASGIVKTDDTTEATSTTDGSLQTDGGLSVAKDAVFGDDVKLLSDSAVLSFGADSDTTLTHTDGTGLTLNSTNKLLFGDTGTYIHQSADGVLDLVSDTEIEINATTIDINGAVAMDGAITGATNITLSGELDAATLDISGNADIDGTTNLDAVDIDGAVQIDAAVTVGVDDTGYDVKFFGATSGAYMLLDESTDDLILAGAAKLYLYDAGGGEYLSSSGSALTIASGGTAWELPTSDGSANQLLKTDGSGNLDWTTVSGTITSLNNQSANRITTIGSTTTELDGEANLSFTGSALTCIGTVTVGVDDTGHDVKFFGATSGAYMLWDESADDLVLAGAAGIDLAGDIDVDGTANLDNTDIDGTLAVDGTTISLDATTSLNIDNSNTSNGITIGTATSGVPVSIGHTTSEVTVNDNLTVTGTLTLGSGAELTEAELEMLDGITAGTIAASKAVVVDSNKDAASFRNVTLTGELDAATLDISGNADIDGTTNLDAVDIDGAVQLDATLTVGADDQGYDVKLFGDTASAYMLWDTSADDLILGGAAGLIVPEGQFTLGSTAVTATAAELNLLDGGTSVGSSITLADADGIVVNDGGSMKTIPASDLKTYNPGGTSWQSVITSNTTMVSGRGYFVNTTSAAITMTLPASPSIGDTVNVIDYAGTADTNNITIGRNSQPIMGAAEDLTVATERAAFALVYSDSTHGWLLTDK